MSEMNADEDDVVPLFEDITQQQMCLWPFEYHALSSAYRMATSSESYLRNIRNQKLNSAFVTSSSPSVAVAAASNDEQSAAKNSSCASPYTSLVYQPIEDAGVTSMVTVTPADRSSTPYTVSIPVRAVMTSDDHGNERVAWTCFHDTMTKTEHSIRHPGTTIDSDVEEDEDIDEKYPEYKATDVDSPITTVAAEQLNCIAFVGPLGETVTELKASYPLQLSVRIDESRKSVIFDCFEYKPPFAIDLDDPDLTSYYPTNRAWERWTQAFMSHNINNDEDDYKDDYNDIDYYDGDILLDNKMIKEEGGGILPIYVGSVGDFAYSRCLRFRFSLNNIVGIRLQTTLNTSQNKTDRTARGGKENVVVGAVLVLELSHPPPADAFAVRKVKSRWFRENNFDLAKDWTQNSAASKATRIYLYGGLDELTQVAALMAKKWPPIAAMLASSKPNKNNSLFSSSLQYSASPNFLVSETVVSYGNESGDIRINKYEDLSYDDQRKLRVDCRNNLCRHCGAIYFLGHTGFPCSDCGDGRFTINLGAATESAFDGRIDKALEVFESKCRRLDEEKSGTALKRKVLGD